MTDALAPIRMTAGEEDAQIDITQTYLRPQPSQTNSD
jgi:hypothetical protein